MGQAGSDQAAVKEAEEKPRRKTRHLKKKKHIEMA
jgi:hypothetical protein